MYFPYLRGKLYELVAIRELIQKNLIQSSYISPIIEPVRDNGTFNSLIKVSDENKYVLNIISNPQVGGDCQFFCVNKSFRLIDSLTVF
ncbi:MAG: sce7725 family protein [Bacilli bacterium]|nr:sce7725 family protein [Bacilli bacterium]